MTNHGKMIGFLTVACDSKRVQTIQLTCRCGHTWQERVPGELHDSELQIILECSRCQRVHILQDHKLTSISKEDYHDRRKTASPINEVYGIGNDKQQYDA